MPAPAIHRDESTLGSFATDAAHVGGTPAGVAFPADAAEAAALVRAASRVLTVGAQSSLTGGATPRGDVVLSTRAMNVIGTPRDGRVRIGAGVTIAALQHHLAGLGLWYPPAPTFEGATAGGVVATNAAGAATFKYGATRPWVTSLTAVLASGDVLDVERGMAAAAPGDDLRIELASGGVITARVPTYAVPQTAKLSAGYYVHSPTTDLVDLLVGSEGTLAVVTDVTMRVAPIPLRAVALVTCRDDAQAYAVGRMLRDNAHAAWASSGPLDVSAIEYMDERSVALLTREDFVRAAVPAPPPGRVLLLVQIEMPRGEAAALERLADVLGSCGVDGDPSVSLPGDRRGAERLFGLREAVPAAVNAAVGIARRDDARIQKTAGDMIVPFELVPESLRIYREAFTSRGLRYAVWGHLSDGNLHPNILPASFDDVRRGREALLEIAHRVMAIGGAALAEHGVGRNPLKQLLLREMYGDEGIAQMRTLKRAFDPEWKLAAGVLFERE